jgi:hypothetical protein
MRLGRPRKTLQSIRADFRRTERGRIYFGWQAFYRQAKLRVGDRAARGGATRMMAAHFGKTRRRIQQIVSDGDALTRADAARASTESARQNARVRAFREMYAATEAAVEVLRKPAYCDLLADCAMLSRVQLPYAMGTFSSESAATSPKSLQRLTAALARAFLRAHEIADREVSGYSERLHKAKQK